MRLTKKELEYIAKFPPNDDYECSVCGRVDKGYIVQPVFPWEAPAAGREGVFMCVDCKMAYNEAQQTSRKAARKRERNNLPACVICGKPTAISHNDTPLCRKHLKVLEAAVIRELGPTMVFIAAANGGMRLSRERIVELIGKWEKQ